MSIGESLGTALAGDEFEVHYQEQVALGDRRVIGVEALVRWRHPELGLLGPDRFIPLAEDQGVVADIDAWVRGRALDDHAAARVAGEEIAVNLSPLSARPGLDIALAGELAGSGVAPSALVVEVTERVRVRDLPGAVATLGEVAAVGVRLALDDFGAGQTSVIDLAHLPVDRIKLDKSLVADLVGHAAPRARLVVRAIADLGEHLGMEVMAEGVEFEVQEAILLAEGILLGQGFLYGRPEPAVAVA